MRIAKNDATLDILGIKIPFNCIGILEMNYDPILLKVQAILNQWKARNLSLCGKIVIIKSLCVSLFTYKMLVLPAIPERVVKHFEEMCQKFIWNSKKAKVKLSTLQCEKKPKWVKTH